MENGFVFAPFLPQGGEIECQLPLYIQALFIRSNQSAWRIDVGNGDIRSIGQKVSTFPGEIEQGRLHHSSQFNGNLFYPVEGFVAGQGIQNLCRALADRRLQIMYIIGRDNGGDGLSMLCMGRLIHANETGHPLAGRAVANTNAARLRGRGIGRVIQLHLS
jgi:hypothetical protein